MIVMNVIGCGYTKLFNGDIGHEPSLEPPTPPDAPVCPVCGSETDTFYYDKYHEIVGCSECIETRDAWEVIGE